MHASERSAELIRFGEFEVDLQAAELRRNGTKIRIDGQPFRVLEALLQGRGTLVTRDELIRNLWPDGTFVDFDHGINESVKRLREALGDSAQSPRFIETLRGRGYRFIYPVSEVGHHPVRRSFLFAAVGTMVVLSVLAIVVHRRQNETETPAIRSLAVLPLSTVSKSADQDYFANGITADLIAELGKHTSLRVISSRSMTEYQDTKKSLDEIANELKVDAIVKGSVVREGDRILLTAQLIQTRPERSLWSQSYEQELSAILRLQRELAQKIAAEVRAFLLEEDSTAPAGDVEPSAYDLYLRGTFYLERAEGEGIAKSIDCFRQALEIDPMFAPAWAGLADGYNRAAILHQRPSLDAYPIAKAAADRALSIDPQLPDGHVVAGVVKLRYERDWSGAESSLVRALKINPSSSRARLGYATYLIAVGQMDRAVQEAALALELDPLAPQRHVNLGWSLQHAERHPEAVRHFKTALSLKPDLPGAHALLGKSYLELGLTEEAVRSCETALSLPPDVVVIPTCGRVFASVRGEAGEELLSQLTRKSPPPAYLLARFHDTLGRFDEALEWLELAVDQREPEVCFMNTEDWSSNILAHPRYQRLVQQMGFPAEEGQDYP